MEGLNLVDMRLILMNLIVSKTVVNETHEVDNQVQTSCLLRFPSLVMYEMGWNREDVREAFPSIFT